MLQSTDSVNIFFIDELNNLTMSTSTTDIMTTVPLLALSVEAQTMLSTLLNPVKIIPTESNLPRDWRGLAELSNIPAEKMTLFEGKPDPFKEVLSFLSAVDAINVTIDDLKAFLAVVDRFDVLEDVAPVLDRDIFSYKNRISKIRLNREIESGSAEQDASILTFEDAARAQKKLPMCRYDAFILYSDDDSDFASEILSRMETDYDLKLCSRDRDLLPGLRFEHEVIGKMIEARCNRLLVIFSPSFLESPANQFLVSYAQAVALDTRCRKIVPCVYKKCDLPPSVRYSFCIDYNRSGKHWNFWDKLSQSLAVPTSARSEITVPVEKTSFNSKAEQWKNIEYNANNLVADSLNVNITKDGMEWWDASKPEKPVEQYVSPVSEINANHYSQQIKQLVEHHEDALSVNSQAQLLPSASSSSHQSKPSTWLSKMMSPINRKKRSSAKTKQKPIAE